MTAPVFEIRRAIVRLACSGCGAEANASCDCAKKCLMSVSADSDYLAWLPGRNLSERDRSPCYSRLKVIFSRRLTEDNGGKKQMLPAPAWASK